MDGARGQRHWRERASLHAMCAGQRHQYRHSRDQCRSRHRRRRDLDRVGLSTVIVRFVGLLLAGLLCASSADAAWQSRDSNYNESVGSGSVGPGDLITFTKFWSNTRAYSVATRGQALVNVCNSTGGTDVLCADLSTSLTTGLVVPATISGITCPGNVNCTIRTFYNQVSPGTSDTTQATISLRNTFNTTAPSGVPCSTGNAGPTSIYSTAAIAISPPFSMYSVSFWATGATGNFNAVTQENGSQFPGIFSTQAANTLNWSNTSSITQTFTFGNWAVVVGTTPVTGNGTMDVNGSATAGANGNGSLTTAGYTLHNWRNNPGCYGEDGIIPSDATSVQGLLTSNARSLYGF